MTKPGARATIDALEYGAVDYVLKPSFKTGTGLAEMIGILREKIKLAYKADIHLKKNNNF